MLIFNDLWDEFYEEHNDSEPVHPIGDKELSIWKNKHKKEHALIVASVSEEVIYYLVSIKYSYGALKKLKDLYDSH